MESAQPTFVSLPFWCREMQAFARRVDYQNKEYITYWEGDWNESLDIQDPCIRRNMSLVPHNHERNAVWTKSVPLDYGSYSQIRLVNHEQGAFPVLKICHDDGMARTMIRKEFEILRSIKQDSLVRIDYEALTDAGGVFGYRMELLFPLDPQEVKRHLADIVKALSTLHGFGVIHGDMSPNNVMRRRDGSIALIDLGRCGKIGEELEDSNPWRARDSTHYTRELDVIQFRMTFELGSQTLQLKQGKLHIVGNDNLEGLWRTKRAAMKKLINLLHKIRQSWHRG